MLQTNLSKTEIVAFAKQATQEWSSMMACEPCLSLGKEAQEWLDKVATLDEDRLDDAPATPLRAIEDARD